MSEKTDKRCIEAGFNDSPYQMIMAFQEQNGALIEMMDMLDKQRLYDLEEIFDKIRPLLIDIIPDLATGFIIGKKEQKNKEDRIKYHVTFESNESKPLLKRINELDKNSVKILETAMDEERSKHGMCWNYIEEMPKFIEGVHEKQAFALCWMCDHPDDESLFIGLVRDIPKKRPFLSHEIQGLKMTSKIIGWYSNYAFVHQLLLYDVYKRGADIETR